MKTSFTFLTSALLLFASTGFAQDNKWDKNKYTASDSTSSTYSTFIYGYSLSGRLNDADNRKQDRKEMQDADIQQLKSLKIAFFTDAMKLTTEEAQKFWPVYNEYIEKKEKISQDRRAASIKIRESSSELSDKEATTTAYNFVNASKLDAELQMQYFDKFKTILPPAKLLQLYKSEEEFKGYLINMIRQGGNGKRN